MNATRLATYALIGFGVYLILRNVRSASGAVSAPLLPPKGNTPNATTVPPSFFNASQAGSDLQKAYGTATPTGESRNLIR